MGSLDCCQKGVRNELVIETDQGNIQDKEGFPQDTDPAIRSKKIEEENPNENIAVSQGEEQPNQENNNYEIEIGESNPKEIEQNEPNENYENNEANTNMNIPNTDNNIVQGTNDVDIKYDLPSYENNVIGNVENVVNQENVSREDTNTIDTNQNIVQNSNHSENEVLNFVAPVSGEIIKDFSVDTLVFSNTLKEWTIHNGIDIKADKTSIVVASETGTVESIKNDPRFGLTITIIHDNGFKTIYSNLLTTEFVKENEKVEKGQTIATIGESASFEVADEPHLHFEMYKDGEVVNPTIYLKDV